jgi:hypothetical protein
MKKKWVELKKGIIIEANSIRSVNAGDTQESLDTAKYLYVGFVGERNKTTFTFETNKEKWKAYEKLRDALIEKESEKDL